LCCYFVSQSSEFCRHNPLCCFSTSVYCCLFRYRLSPETFGYTLVPTPTVNSSCCLPPPLRENKGIDYYKSSEAICNIDGIFFRILSDVLSRWCTNTKTQLYRVFIEKFIVTGTFLTFQCFMEPVGLSLS